MRKIAVILLIISVLILAGCVRNSASSAAGSNSQSFETKITGTTEDGDVAVELTPGKMENGKIEIYLSANTHSVDLSQFDLSQMTTLQYRGKKSRPESAPALSGHHASGTLVFKTGRMSGEFVIELNGLPKENIRAYSWRA